MIWNSVAADPQGEGIEENKCILHRNGNLVIYDKTNNPIWYSTQKPLNVCEGMCKNDSSCTLGLKCYLQDGTNNITAERMLTATDSPVPSDSQTPSEEPSDSQAPSDQPSDSQSPSEQPSDSQVPSEQPSDSQSPSEQPSDSQVPSEQPSDSQSPSNQPSTFPSFAPSMTPVPGCSKENTGGNFCIIPEFEGALVKQSLVDYGPNGNLVKTPLDACEGNCNKDSHCKDGLVCFLRNSTSDPSPPGCTGTPTEIHNYCMYPQLKEIVAVEALDNNGAFIKVGDDGIVKVFSSNVNTLIWWSSVDQLVQETAFLDPRSDISIHLVPQLLYAGTYMHSSIYTNDNTSEGGFHVNGTYIEVHGSISVAYELLEQYYVSAQSKISFTVTLGSDVEALAICMDDGLIQRTEKDNRAETTCLALGGSSIDTVLDDPKKLSDFSSGPRDVVYLLHELFPTRESSQMKFVGFVQRTTRNSGDRGVPSPSIIERIRFYEDDQDTQRKLEEVVMRCPGGELAATSKAGLQDTKHNIQDFCVSSEILLKQIELDEGDYCLRDFGCRSGLCNKNSETCKSRVRPNSVHT